MSVDIRPVHPDEMDQFGAIAAYVYAGRYGDTSNNFVAQSTDPSWTLGAFVNGRMASSFATIPFTIRLNGNAAKLGGVSAVGTLPEFRRRGFLRQMMTQAIADMRDRGQSISALWASQASIYQRYGYALATSNVDYTLNPRDIQFVQHEPPQGVCRHYDLDAGYPIVRQLYIEFISARMLYLHRSKALWGNNILEPEPTDGPLHIAIYFDTQETPQGYMAYTTRNGRVDDAARPQELVIRDLAWMTPDAYLGLWSFVAKHDLVGRVRALHMSPDDPAPIWFQEPRLLHPQRTEGIWLRLIDVHAALQARGYTTAGHLTIKVVGDDLAEWNNGVFELATDGRSTEVKPSPSTPDIQVDIRTLAALYSGQHGARTLSHWGLLSGEPQAISRAEQLFQSEFAPHCPDHF